MQIIYLHTPTPINIDISFIVYQRNRSDQQGKIPFNNNIKIQQQKTNKKSKYNNTHNFRATYLDKTKK